MISRKNKCKTKPFLTALWPLTAAFMLALSSVSDTMKSKRSGIKGQPRANNGFSGSKLFASSSRDGIAAWTTHAGELETNRICITLAELQKIVTSWRGLLSTRHCAWGQLRFFPRKMSQLWWKHCVRFNRSQIWTSDLTLQRRTRYCWPIRVQKKTFQMCNHNTIMRQQKYGWQLSCQGK